jgi:hypothetical protein
MVVSKGETDLREGQLDLMNAALKAICEINRSPALPELAICLTYVDFWSPSCLLQVDAHQALRILVPLGTKYG